MKKTGFSPPPKDLTKKLTPTLKHLVGGFSLTELLIIVAIIVILAAIVIFAINPAKMLTKSRDAERNSDLTAMATAVNLYLADNKDFSGLTGPYKSTDNLNQKNDGTGWIPLKFNTISSGAPLGVLPFDPINNSTYYYTFGVNPTNKTYEINCVFELSNNVSKQSTDGGNNNNVYEIGTDLTILP